MSIERVDTWKSSDGLMWRSKQEAEQRERAIEMAATLRATFQDVPDEGVLRDLVHNVLQMMVQPQNSESMESIHAWGVETFPDHTEQSVVSRAMKEISELLTAAFSNEELQEETADVIITLLRMPRIVEAINMKMHVNRKRTWRIGSDGHYQHVEETVR